MPRCRCSRGGRRPGAVLARQPASAVENYLDAQENGSPTKLRAATLLRYVENMIEATFKLPPNSSAAAAWAPVREDLSKVALAYEVTPSR